MMYAWKMRRLRKGDELDFHHRADLFFNAGVGRENFYNRRKKLRRGLREDGIRELRLRSEVIVQACTRCVGAVTMSTLNRQGHRLIQAGVALFLFTSFEGFAIPFFAAPLLGRSVHTLSALLGLILLTLGLVWPRLVLGAATSRIAFWFLLYSGLAIVAAFLMAALWGAGNASMPLAAAARGTPLEETLIMIVAYSSAPTGIISFALILWGLRIVPPQQGLSSDSAR
ncbi:hypothetical protein [Bradyrhizobium sp. BR 1432]|uniref:hypothetical protein n=1 Tax=Bradyrhizobium sp. BR 1432 TaxID=3447966 RepID=UPI003EE68314